MEFLSLLLLGLAPGVAITFYIYWRDKHEREPLGLLTLSFFLGVLSTALAMILTQTIIPLISFSNHPNINHFSNAFIGIGFVEEFSKFIFIRLILFHNKNFNEPFDGIVYSVMVGMGFATLENTLYAINYGLATALLRIFTAVPAHSTFAILMGYYLGKAKFSRYNSGILSISALLVATLFHGLYDYFWFISYIPGLWIGGLLSLLIALLLSRKAIRLHTQISPFIQPKDGDD